MTAPAKRKRGKVRTPIEFGHRVFLAESAQGLITQYEVLKGNPSDDIQVAPSLDRHMEAFGRVPELYGSDRGFFSEQNLASCKHDGVKVVCIPQRGGKKTAEREAYETSAHFKQGQRFRAGIEGRISVLFRGRGHEALSRRGKRSLRVVGCCGCARQQPDENRGAAHEAIVSQTKNRLFICGKSASAPSRSSA